MKDDATLPMIGNLHQYLPSTCSCKSPDCTKLSTLSAPYTKQLQLNKYFMRSDEIRHEFLMNSIKVLDWVFRNSKTLNQDPDSIAILDEAVNIIESSDEIRHLIERSLKIYILKWISFSFADDQRIIEFNLEVTSCNNKFIKFMMDTLLNSPFIEDQNFIGKSISLRQYLHFGNILQAAFNYITKNHKIREAKTNCQCCICSSNFSPEDVEFIFAKNFVKNMRKNERRGNVNKICNFLNNINKNSLILFKRNSFELDQFITEIHDKCDLLRLGKYLFLQDVS